MKLATRYYHEQTSTPSATPEETVAPSPIPTALRTDLSDNRSDGRTDSLGCLKPSDNCNTTAVASVQQTVRTQELPATGEDAFFFGTLLLSGMIMIIGVYLVVKHW